MARSRVCRGECPSNLGKELVLDMRSEGEVFGTARLWQKHISRLEGLKIRSLGDLLRVAKA